MEKKLIQANQYGRRRQIELWNLPKDFHKKSTPYLKSEVASLLSLTGEEVNATHIDTVHGLKKPGNVIVELTTRTLHGKILRGRKNLKNAKDNLRNLNCPKLSIVKSMSHEYKKLDFVCRRLAKDKLIHKTFFFNRKLHVIAKEGDKEHEFIGHISDLYALFGEDVINNYLKK